MALSNDPVFEQGIRTFSGILTAANTNLDGTGTIVNLVTAGANGSKITDLMANARATVTATAIRLYVSRDAGVTWIFKREYLMGAYAVANTTAQSPVVMVSPTSPDSAIKLAPGEVLGASIAVALAGGMVIDGALRDM